MLTRNGQGEMMKWNLIPMPFVSNCVQDPRIESFIISNRQAAKPEERSYYVPKVPRMVREIGNERNNEHFSSESLSDLMLALIQQREKKDRTDDLNVQVQDEIGMVREDSKVRILAVEMILWHKRWHMV
ncbi:hypothetical protein DAI22_09g164700 [Oryza sativa Japonica Group]|nr:hypothetical protein DAI22_09g164700 [Oryza sativa Japonica Group]